MIILIITCVVCAYIIVSWTDFMKDRSRVDIPGPLPLPVLGNAVIFAVNAKKFLAVLSKMAETYGSTVLVYILTDRYILLTHPKYIEAVASNTEFNTKGISYHFLEPWLGQGLLTASGPRWKSHRKFLTPAFHFNILQNFLTIFCNTSRILNKKLQNLADGKTAIDLFPIIALAALDNVTEAIMGVSVNAQKDSESEYVKSIEDLSNVISTRMRNPVVGHDRIFNLLPHKRRQDRALKVLHGQTNKVIEARRRELKLLDISTQGNDSELGIKNKHAFLDLLLLANIDGKKISDEAVREEVDTFMFEGHDTTTSAIVFTLFCISKYEDVQQKILEEQKSIFRDDMTRDPSFSELQQMKYLELVIKESLRLYPSVPLIARYVKHDTHVADIFIPKNTSIILDIIHMQRRADIYDDPLEFRPERFTNMESKNSFNWLAFSAGPRNCIGQKFAMMEMKVTLSAIIKSFRVLPSGVEPELCADLILRSCNGVHVKFAPRK